jgi:hypothetical protein
MMSKIRIATAAIVCLCGVAAYGQNAGPNAPPNVYNDYRYESFTLPNGAGGNVTAINDLGWVAGTYYPAGCCSSLPYTGTGEAYIRYPGGTITLFTIANATAVSMTVHGLNNHGELIGSYDDKTTGNTVGYIRHSDGKITTFSLGGATEQTVPTGLNDEGLVFGVIANYNQPTQDVAFLRYPDGQYLTYGVPGAQSLFTSDINNRGVGLGSYFCSNSVGGVCAFYGKPGGNVETFDYPPNGLIPAHINDRGVISGEVDLPVSGSDYFLRYPDGKFELLGLSKIEGKETSISIDSLIDQFNDRGEFLGQYSVYYPIFNPPNSINSSYTYDFIRTPDGKIKYYDPPNNPGVLQGYVLNNRGVIAGTDLTKQNGLFVMVPKHCDD